MSGEGPLAPYPSPEARTVRLRASADRLRAELVEYGTSGAGEPLLAVRLPARGTRTSRLLCTANVHGPEFVGCQVALALLDAAAAGDPRVEALRERAELWVVPCLNPDGYRKTWERGGAGTLASLRPNAAGVDLNRNFPLPLGHRPPRLPGAGTTTPGKATYRGEHPLSEPETAALDALLHAHPMHASANLHSFMGTLIPAHVRDRGSYATYRRLCGAFRRGQTQVRYRRLASRHFDVFTGELEDHQHHVHGTWAICVEVFPWLASLRQHVRAPSLFWRFNPRDPKRWIDNDLPGVLAFFAAARDEPHPCRARHDEDCDPPPAVTRTGS